VSEEIVPPSVEIPTGNAIDVFLSGLERTSKSQRVFSHGSGSHKTMEQIYRNLESAYQRLFQDQTEPIDVEIRANQMFCERRVAYESNDARNSLSKLLHSAGIRLLTIRPGAARHEILQFIETISVDFSKPENMDSDLYSAFKEAAFDHFEIVSDDLIQNSIVRNPELIVKMQQFQQWVQMKTQARSAYETRRLRPDDVKVLEEFQIKSSAFSKPDQEVSEIVKQMTKVDQPQNREHETLERLALMGFHFLLQETDSSQMQVGRDLVIQVAKMSLASQNIILFGGLLRKIQELHRERQEKRGEYQKILDSIYHTDQQSLYLNLLQSHSLHEKALQLLLQGPPCSVRLLVLLLGDDPSLIKAFGPIIMKQLPDQLSWLLEEVQRDPNRAAWEQVVNLLSSRPNPLFGRFLSKLLETASQTVRVKLLRQCALIGTLDSLSPFRILLESKKKEDRMEAYEYLSVAKNKSALGLLKARLDSPEFSSAEEDEQAAGYAGIFRMGEELAYPLFESKWIQAGRGIFKTRSQHQRRLMLAKAVLRAQQETYFTKILEKTPRQELARDLLSLLDAVASKRKDLPSD